MAGHLCYANADTPRTGEAWAQLSDVGRIALVNNKTSSCLSDLDGIVTVTEARQDGQVIVSLTRPVSADKRGTLLLDFEKFLKENVDPGLVVWLEPVGDRSSLRNLRGIEVKS
jgi:hypothetical protein